MVHNKRTDKLLGVQFITYNKMSIDVEKWAISLIEKEYSNIIGIPRSGLTVAHMLSSILNIPCITDFRQSTGRSLLKQTGPIFVVDDCCSYGTTFLEFDKTAYENIEFGAVYARDFGAKRAKLNSYANIHAEPNWLVITEWNWRYHQDSHYISITKDVSNTIHLNEDNFNKTYDNLNLISFNNFLLSSSMLLVTASKDAYNYSKDSNKPILYIPTMDLFGPENTIFKF